MAPAVGAFRPSGRATRAAQRLGFRAHVGAVRARLFAGALGGYLSRRLASRSAPGLWLLKPQVDWYVGASGALHGVMAAGTLAHLQAARPRRLDPRGFIVGKLTYEQFAGSMPFAGGANTIVDAHLYGAIGGLAAALVLKPSGR